MANRRRQPHQHVFEPVPVSYLNAVLQSFWDEYAGRRIEGMDPDEAVTEALGALLPPDELDDVEQMLSGELDEEFSVGAPFDGRMMLDDLIAKGDHYAGVQGR
jgi:hypothetical protein